MGDFGKSVAGMGPRPTSVAHIIFYCNYNGK